MEVCLALSVSFSLPVDHLFHLLMVLLNVTKVILVILTVIVAVVKQGAPVTRHRTQELHLSGESLQLTPELPVLLLELSHGSSERPAQAGRLLQTTLHAQLKSADIHVDLPDGIPESVLVTGESCTHGLPLWRGRPGVTQVSNLSEGWGFHRYSCSHSGNCPDSLSVCELTSQSELLWSLENVELQSVHCWFGWRAN